MHAGPLGPVRSNAPGGYERRCERVVSRSAPRAATELSRTGPASPHPKQRTHSPPPTTSTSFGWSCLHHQALGSAFRRAEVFLPSLEPLIGATSSMLFERIQGSGPAWGQKWPQVCRQATYEDVWTAPERWVKLSRTTETPRASERAHSIRGVLAKNKRAKAGLELAVLEKVCFNPALEVMEADVPIAPL